MDTTVPGIAFDDAGICSFCEVHDRMERAFPLGEAGLRTVARHQHVHTQLSYVESGVFAVRVAEEEERVLHAGDSFYVPSEAWHGVECLETGVLLDVFSPARADFL